MRVVRRVQRNGVVTLPKEMRKRSGLREGDYVFIECYDDRIVISARHADVQELFQPEPKSSECVLIDLRERRPERAHLARPIRRVA